VKNIEKVKFILNHAGLIVFISCFLTINSIYIWALDLSGLYEALIYFFILLIFFGTAYVLSERLSQIKDKSLRIQSLVYMYFEYILMFTGLYALSALLSYGEAFKGHEFIRKEILDTSVNFKRDIFFKEQFIMWVDALYFSVSVGTTVGFGDIHAKSPIVKMFVVIQVLSSIAIAILGAGYFFNSIKDEGISNKRE